MRAAAIVLVLPAFGLTAGLTGQDTPAKVDFAKEIAPIFVRRCIECHGPDKDKGDLRLDKKELAFPAGDEDYWTILAGKPDDSELLNRVTLPDGHDDIMPQKGEPLSKDQQALIRRWIAEGADWPAAGDEAIAAALAAAVIPKLTFELPALDDAATAAIEPAMSALREQGAVVQRVAADTEAIDVNLSLLRDKVTDETLALLEPLAPRLVWLNVSRTAITDAGAASLGKLTQLRRLHAANTALGDGAVKALAGLGELEFANFYATKITDDALPVFQTLPKLKKLHAWQSGVTADGVKAIRDHFAKFEVDLGDYAEQRMAAAEQEIAERAAQKAAEEAAKDEEIAKGPPINDVCPVSGKPVDAEFTVVHDGKKIAFCCGKCKAAFEKEPGKFQVAEAAKK
ncbi:MAG: hypothetical protein KDE27_18640 [Planctomycetes bacterium]|nr:hypothetical protein [Planctomycetota bacterium]